jgi:polynucleotide 5'-kinase involved in rRNA processing
MGGWGEVKSVVGLGERLDGVFLVAGPAAFELESGEGEILGYNISPGERIVVPEARRVPVRLRNARLHWVGGSLLEASKELYARMEQAARALSSLEGKVVVIGPTDAGKSTLVSWAANLASSRPTVLSVDIGQNEYYAPAFEALVEAPEPPLIPGLPSTITWTCFVGAFTPSRALSSYVACASRLARKASDPLFIDTDGWILEPRAVAVKASLIDAINADYIVTVSVPKETGTRLAAATTAKHAFHIDYLKVSKKSRDERRAHRERLITARLLNSKYRILDAGKVPLINSPVFNCSESGPQGPGVIYSEKCEGYAILVVRKPFKTLRSHGIQLLVEGWERDRISAIVAPDGNHHISVIAKIDYRRRGVHIRTPYDGEAKALLIGEVQAPLTSSA